MDEIGSRSIAAEERSVADDDSSCRASSRSLSRLMGGEGLASSTPTTRRRDGWPVKGTEGGGADFDRPRGAARDTQRPEVPDFSAAPAANPDEPSTRFDHTASLDSLDATHREMSRVRFRTRIIATMTERKSTISIELTIENQWTCVSGRATRRLSMRRGGTSGVRDRFA